jgi:hypothetical protein
MILPRKDKMDVWAGGVSSDEGWMCCIYCDSGLLRSTYSAEVNRYECAKCQQVWYLWYDADGVCSFDLNH